MNHYEVTFLTLSEDDTAGVADLIAQLGGTISHQLPPVRRKLAYPIKRETTAVYYSYEFDLDAAQTAELENKLRRNEHILRHLVVAGGIRKGIEAPRKLKETGLEIPESLKRGMAELAAADKASAKKKADEALATPPEAVIKPPPAGDEVPADAEGSTAKERQKKLDEKLKSILGE